MTDVVRACRRFLASKSDLTAVLGSSDVFTTYIFRDKLQPVLEASGKAALVIQRAGAWAQANRHNTMKFPMIRVEAWVDPGRDGNNGPENNNAEELAYHVWEKADWYLHDTANRFLYWDDLRIVKSARWQDPYPFELNDADKTYSIYALYGVILG